MEKVRKNGKRDKVTFNFALNGREHRRIKAIAALEDRTLEETFQIAVEDYVRNWEEKKWGREWNAR